MKSTKSLRTRSSKFLSLILAVILAVGVLPAAAFAADDDSTAVVGAMNEDTGVWEFVIPEDAAGEVVLDFTGYVDRLVRNCAYDHWTMGNAATLPFSVTNASGKTYKYADTDFALDMSAESEDDIYYIDGKTPYDMPRSEEIPFRSIIRTANMPLQSLYGGISSDRLTVEQVANAEKKIAEHGEVTFNKKTAAIPDTVTTYADYALWYYNTFFDLNAETLDDMPVKFKLNLLGYAVVNDGMDLEQGNITVEETIKATGMTEEEIDTALVQKNNALTEGRRLGYDLRIKRGGTAQKPWAWATYTCIMMETDPEIIKLGQDVLYRYGLRFSFDYKPDYDKLFFVDDTTSLEEFQALMDEWMNDNGDLGWSVLCNTDLDVDTLNGADLTYAQNSVKNSVGTLRLEAADTVNFERPYMTMPAYAVVNAHEFMGAMKGLSFTITLKELAPAMYDTAELGLTKKVTGADLAENQFEFAIASEAEDGILFENATAKNDKDGKIDFGRIAFTKDGKYLVTVKEVLPEEVPEGWKFDDTEKQFVFVATENGFGFDVEVAPVGDSTEFVNDYKEPEVPEKPAEKPETPDTGDSSMVLTFAVLAAASVLAAGALYRKKVNR